VRDHAEVVRLIHGGADPNRSWLVASDFSDSHRPETITPLEAAVQIRRLELVELLVREGATVDEPVRARLVARARDLHADDIVAYLNRRGEGPR